MFDKEIASLCRTDKTKGFELGVVDQRGGSIIKGRALGNTGLGLQDQVQDPAVWAAFAS